MRSPIPTIKIAGILFLTLAFYACNTAPSKRETATPAGSNVIADTLQQLLHSARTADTLERENSAPFFFFQSGHLFNSTEKHALAVISPTDSTTQLKLYRLQDHAWQLMDSIDRLPGISPAFHASYADYNFDGQPDIYIQQSASNGYVMSRGYLLIVDALTGKITPHQEIGELANMRPDVKKLTVYSEDLVNCSNKDKSPVCTLRNKWIDGQLKTIEKKCDCD